MSDEWRPAPGLPGYEVSSRGQVRSLPRVVVRANGAPLSVRGRLLTLRVMEKGYIRVKADLKQWRVHRLVCEAFHGAPSSPQMQVRHLNGVPGDNRAENLAWGTASENSADTLRHGRHRLASKTHCKRGHEFTEENTYHPPSHPQRRQCFTCIRAYRRRHVVVGGLHS